MKLSRKLCTLFVALAPLTSCGYVQHKLLMGGISSGGDKPTDEPTTETADPTTGELPQQKDETPAPPGAPLVACTQGPQVQGGIFRAEETLAQVAPCEANAERRLACVVDLAFVGEAKVGKVTATTATGETASLSYRTCGRVLTITLPSQPGVAETHAFEIQDDGQRLVHLASGRAFRRVEN